MDEMCRARVCLDLPGRGEFCYRLVEYLAVGACVIGPELETALPRPLESGVHLVRVPRDLDGLVDACERLLSDSDLRETISRNAAEYFDRYLALEQLGGYYLDAIWRRLHG
jgi:glycosyltransferase involved in cell wall biosynthesis